MGIKQLTKLLSTEAPSAVKEAVLKEFTGRKVAIDASMAIYQFLVAVRSSDGGAPAQMLANEAGEVTSHIQGMFNRTIRLLENGIKPIYVFDGKPPVLKSGELAKRTAAKEKAHEDLKTAQESGTVEDVNKFSRRTVHMTREHQEDCKTLLRLMGVPVIEAPCEAEAQCAALAKDGIVFASASEDMDTLTFGSPRLLRRLTFTDAKKLPILQFDLDEALRCLKLSMDQFVDLCILCGCDYCDSIKGIGPKTALKLIQKYKTLDAAIKHIDGKHGIPENFDYQAARTLFISPEVLADTSSLPASTFQIKAPDEEKLVEFLCDNKGFNRERVEKGIAKLKKARGAGTQQRMDSFFSAVPKSAATATTTKRKSTGSSAQSKKKKLT